jgi:hypothetical protein
MVGALPDVRFLPGIPSGTPHATRAGYTEAKSRLSGGSDLTCGWHQACSALSPLPTPGGVIPMASRFRAS